MSLQFRTAGQCAVDQQCNAPNSDAAAATGTSTLTGVCVTPIAAGAAWQDTVTLLCSFFSSPFLLLLLFSATSLCIAFNLLLDLFLLLNVLSPSP